MNAWKLVLFCVFASNLGCETSDKSSPKAADNPLPKHEIELKLVRSPPGSNPIFYVVPCAAELPTPHRTLGYSLLIRRDGVPLIHASLNADQVRWGMLGYLQQPSLPRNSKWSMPVELTTDTGYQQLSNSIEYDPLDTSSVAVASYGKRRSDTRLELEIGPKGATTDGKVFFSPSGPYLRDRFGQPSHWSSTSEMFWDELGFSSSVSKTSPLRVLFNEPDEPGYYPSHLYNGTVTIGGVTIDSSWKKEDIDRHFIADGQFWVTYNGDGKVRTVCIRRMAQLRKKTDESFPDKPSPQR